MAGHTKLTGTLKREDLGTGAWVLHTPDGTRWQLSGEIPGNLADRKVAVSGREAGLFGFAMTGKAFEVDEIRAL